MSDNPAYPPPPNQPPDGYEGVPGPAPATPPTPLPAPSPAPSPVPLAPPPAAYVPAPYYGSPQYGYPPPAGQYRRSGNLRAIIAASIVIAVLLVGVLAYVLIGYAYASSRISDAANAINAVSVHRSYVNSQLDLLGQQVSSFETTTDTTAGKATAGQLASETRSMTTLVGGDDQATAAARSHLNDQQWLTVISSGRLSAEATRLAHARKAVATVRSAASDYVLLGQFFEAHFQALIDASTMFADSRNNDLVGTATADAALQADVVKAQQASTNAPGLPSQYHDYLLALAALGVDAAKVLNARTAAAQDDANKLVVADLTAMSLVDFAGTGAKIKSYYQHYRDDFNLEMDRTTA